MATAFNTFDSTPTVIVAAIKQKILASSDWTHLQLSTGTQNTTLSAGASPGAVSISSAITIPSGSCITLWRSASLNGSATLESRITTGVSGAGPFTVTFADALVNTYNSGDAVGVGSYCKATTTRGAQMVIDLADAAASATTLKFGIYRTHDGTTAVDKVNRYINTRTSGGATSDTWHTRVSAGKEHLYLDVEGPRAGEINPVDTTAGSMRQALFLGDVVPYHSSDTIATVILLGNTLSAGAFTDVTVNVGRNQGNTSSWVTAQLASLHPPASFANGIAATSPNPPGGVQRLAAGDSKTYMFPYVIFEATDGLRGRISKAFFTGFNDTGSGSTGDLLPSLYSRLTYGSDTFILLNPDKWATSVVNSPFGRHTSNAALYADSAVIAIPYS